MRKKINTKGKPSKTSETIESENDVILRLNKKTKDVVGFTILNFTKRLAKPYASVKLPITAELSLA